MRDVRKNYVLKSNADHMDFVVHENERTDENTSAENILFSDPNIAVNLAKKIT